MNEVYEALRRASSQDILVTVVRVVGSAYRRPGAKMLFTTEGKPVGMVSGGCLEADLAEQLRPAPKLLRYDLRGDEDGMWGLGMGCNGMVELLVEPVEPGFWQAVVTEREARRPCTAAVVISEGALLGARLLVRQDGSAVGNLGGLTECARKRLPGVTGMVELGGEQLFVERIEPQPLLWVVGAGPDTPALATAATAAGWQVRTVDRKAGGPEPEELANVVGARDFVVIKNHHFGHDREYVQALLDRPPRYIGVLGPLRRTLKLLEAQSLPPAVYAPVGLDLGGEGPEAVALSIVAELQAVLHGRTGFHLREKAARSRQEAVLYGD